MRSRRDDIDPQLAVDRAFALGLCGFGDDDDRERLARRVERFVAVPDGPFVWTRDGDGLYWLGRLTGPYFYDAEGEAVDFVHVRPCRWRAAPVIESRTPQRLSRPSDAADATSSRSTMVASAKSPSSCGSAIDPRDGDELH
jgi:hypothetical protein